MADQELPQRIRGALECIPRYEERAMFGGVGFLVQGVETERIKLDKA